MNTAMNAVLVVHSFSIITSSRWFQDILLFLMIMMVCLILTLVFAVIVYGASCISWLLLQKET